MTGKNRKNYNKNKHNNKHGNLFTGNTQNQQSKMDRKNSFNIKKDGIPFTQEININQFGEMKERRITDKVLQIEKVEQVPETWEELKELCKELKDRYYKKFRKNKIYLIEEDFIEFMGDDIYGFRVDKDGTISSNDFDQIFKINQTPAQMWQIIKNLIGEER